MYPLCLYTMPAKSVRAQEDSSLEQQEKIYRGERKFYGCKVLELRWTVAKMISLERVREVVHR